MKRATETTTDVRGVSCVVNATMTKTSGGVLHCSHGDMKYIVYVMLASPAYVITKDQIQRAITTHDCKNTKEAADAVVDYILKCMTNALNNKGILATKALSFVKLNDIAVTHIKHNSDVYIKPGYSQYGIRLVGDGILRGALYNKLSGIKDIGSILAGAVTIKNAHI
jgi:hypothetical protein